MKQRVSDTHGLDQFRDQCGVVGVFGHKEAANLTYLGLYALQHRGLARDAQFARQNVHAHLFSQVKYSVFAQRYDR